jgi:hypothetical protein
MPTTVHFVKKARNDYKAEGIKKGESYYWWKFRYGARHRSRTRPRPSQLTQSEFLGNIYDTKENLNDLIKEFANGEADFEDVITACEEAAEIVREQGEECSQKRDNIPEALQDSESGELLQERADQCESVLEGLEEAIEAIQELKGKEENRARVVEIVENVTWDF